MSKSNEISAGDELLIRVPVVGEWPGLSKPLVIEIGGQRFSISPESPQIEKVIKSAVGPEARAAVEKAKRAAKR